MGLLVLAALVVGGVALFAPKVYRAWKAKVIAEYKALKEKVEEKF